MANKWKAAKAAAKSSDWDNLKFKLHFGWGESGDAFRTDFGEAGIIELVPDTQNGKQILRLKIKEDEIREGWELTNFGFHGTNEYVLEDKLPKWVDPKTSGPLWAAILNPVIKLIEDEDLDLKHIKGVYASRFPALGIFLPRSVKISRNKLADIFLFTVQFGNSPDGGATGPPPPP